MNTCQLSLFVLFCLIFVQGEKIGDRSSMFLILFSSSIESYGYSANAKGYQCADTFEGKLLEVLEQDREPMRMRFFDRLVKVCIYCITLASIILAAEILTHYIFLSKKNNSKNIRCANSSREKSNTDSTRVQLPTPSIRTMEIKYK